MESEIKEIFEIMKKILEKYTECDFSLLDYKQKLEIESDLFRLLTKLKEFDRKFYWD